MQGFLAFLKYMDQPVASTLQRLWLKAIFYHDSKDAEATTSAYMNMINAGLDTHVMSLDASELPKIEVWLRCMVHDAFVAQIGALAEEPCPERMIAMGEDAAALAEALAEPTRAVLTGCFRPVAEDARAFAHVMRVWKAKDDDVADLEAAQARLREKRMAAVMAAMTKAEICQEALSKVALLMQASGKDGAGDQKLRLAEKLLADGRVPRLLVTAEKPTITNAEAVQCMSVVNVFDEVVANLQEALACWSPHAAVPASGRSESHRYDPIGCNRPGQRGVGARPRCNCPFHRCLRDNRELHRRPSRLGPRDRTESV